MHKRLKLEKMPKKNKTFKLSQETVERIDRLTGSLDESQAFVIEKALQEFEEGLNDHRRKFMELYRHVGKLMEELEIKRDYPQSSEDYTEQQLEDYFGLDKDEELIHEFYSKMWDEMRGLPFFSEILPKELDHD